MYAVSYTHLDVYKRQVDTQEEACKAFFDDLDKAVDSLDTYLKEGGKEDGVKSINMCNCPTASRWIKFANSLRLRLAMRVSNAVSYTHLFRPKVH